MLDDNNDSFFKIVNFWNCCTQWCCVKCFWHCCILYDWSDTCCKLNFGVNTNNMSPEYHNTQSPSSPDSLDMSRSATSPSSRNNNSNNNNNNNNGIANSKQTKLGMNSRSKSRSKILSSKSSKSKSRMSKLITRFSGSSSVDGGAEQGRRSKRSSNSGVSVTLFRGGASEFKKSMRKRQQSSNPNSNPSSNPNSVHNSAQNSRHNSGRIHLPQTQAQREVNGHFKIDQQRSTNQDKNRNGKKNNKSVEINASGLHLTPIDSRIREGSKSNQMANLNVDLSQEYSNEREHSSIYKSNKEKQLENISMDLQRYVTDLRENEENSKDVAVTEMDTFTSIPVVAVTNAVTNSNEVIAGGIANGKPTSPTTTTTTTTTTNNKDKHSEASIMANELLKYYYTTYYHEDYFGAAGTLSPRNINNGNNNNLQQLPSGYTFNTERDRHDSYGFDHITSIIDSNITQQRRALIQKIQTFHKATSLKKIHSIPTVHDLRHSVVYHHSGTAVSGAQLNNTGNINTGGVNNHGRKSVKLGDNLVNRNDTQMSNISNTDTLSPRSGISHLEISADVVSQSSIMTKTLSFGSVGVSMTHFQKRKEYTLINPLVAILGIGDYDDDPLIGVSRDYKNMIRVFNREFNYPIFYKVSDVKSKKNKDMGFTDMNEMGFDKGYNSPVSDGSDDEKDDIKDNLNKNIFFNEKGTKKQFGYNYKLRWTVEEIHEFINDVHNKINDKESNFDGLIFIISSHGEADGVLLDSEEEDYPLMNIFTRFDNHKCYKLCGKPRIFIIDACRGKTRSKRFPKPKRESKVHLNNQLQTQKPVTTTLNSVSEQKADDENASAQSGSVNGINTDIAESQNLATRTISKPRNNEKSSTNKGNKSNMSLPTSKTQLQHSDNNHERVKTQEWFHKESNFRYIYANAEGYAAFDGGKLGGYLIQATNKTFKKVANSGNSGYHKYTSSASGNWGINDLDAIVNEMRTKVVNLTGSHSMQVVQDVNNCSWKILFEKKPKSKK